MSARALLRAARMRGIQSEALVRALCRVGFVVYRRDPDATILERGTRAVVVPTRAELEGHDVVDLGRIAGLKWRELERLLTQEARDVQPS